MAAHDGAAGNASLDNSQFLFSVSRAAFQAVAAFISSYAHRQLALRQIGRAP